MCRHAMLSRDAFLRAACELCIVLSSRSFTIVQVRSGAFLLDRMACIRAAQMACSSSQFERGSVVRGAGSMLCSGHAF